MSRKKVHIDKLFKEGLKDLSLFVSDRDFNAIDDKSSVFKEDHLSDKSTAFSDFELEITENDWLSTKSKLEIEKNLIATDTTISKAFENFTVEPSENDWHITYDKYRQSKRRRAAFWWLSTGIFVILITSISMYFINTSENVTTKATITSIESSTYENTENYESTPNAKTPNNEQPSANIQEEQTVETDHTKTTAQSSTAKSDVSRNTVNSSSYTSTTSGTGSKTKTQKPSMKKPDEGFKNGANGTSDLSQIGGIGKATKTETTQLNTQNDEKDIFHKNPFGSMEFSKKVPPILADSTTKPGSADVADATAKTDSTKKKNLNLDPPPIPAFQLYAGLVNQIDYTNRVLGKTNNELYNAIRNDADKSMVQFTTGFEFGVKTKKAQVFTGAQYTTQTWSSNYNYTYKTYDSLPYRNPNGDTIGWFVLNPKDTSMHQSRSVSITKIQVPVGFIAFKKINEKFSFSYGASAIFGFNVSSSGDRLLHPDNRQLYGYARLKDNERTMSFSPALNLGLQYQLNKSWMISGSLGGNYSLTSRFKEQFKVEDHPYSIGFNIKLLYLLNH